MDHPFIAPACDAICAAGAAALASKYGGFLPDIAAGCAVVWYIARFFGWLVTLRRRRP